MEIKIISNPFMMGVCVNCYLVRCVGGFVLIDTGRANNRGEIERELASEGCRPGDLRMIVLTHGDFDHSGNAAYLAKKFGSRIAMHADDAGMVERGDMLWNRGRRNPLSRAVFGLMFRLGEADRVKPDLCIGEGHDFSGMGFDARVLEVPGHSKGSIAILTGSGALFCGDLLANVDGPDVWSIVDDRGAMSASVERLKGLPIKTVYPGHGQPFPMELFAKSR